MKKLLLMLVAFGTVHSVARADHEDLERLANSLVYLTQDLRNDARQVIGPYPSYQQRYAYEHIQFLDRSARNFNYAVHSAVTDDHEGIERAYFQLRHDTYYARQTFRNLFNPYRDEEGSQARSRDHGTETLDDHTDPYQMEMQLRRIEQIVYYEIPRYLR